MIKKIILLFSLIIISCNTDESLVDDSKNILNDSNDIISFNIPYNENLIEGIINSKTNEIIFEAPADLNLKEIVPEIITSEKATIKSKTEIDFNNEVEYSITSESGLIKKYVVNYYTGNLLKNPKGYNNGEYWSLCSNCGVEKDGDKSNFYGIATKSSDLNITQEVLFTRDYSNQFVLFIADLWTEKTVVNSITRHPYLWARQKGDFNEDDWPFLQGMLHESNANEWEVVSGIHKLLPNIKSMYFKMSQASQVGDEHDGTKNKYKDIEMRIFKSESDSKYFIENLYRKN